MSSSDAKNTLQVLAIRYPHAFALYNIQHTEKSSIRLTLLARCHFKDSTMLFRQSPFNADEIYMLTTGSHIFKIVVPNQGEEVKQQLET